MQMVHEAVLYKCAINISGFSMKILYLATRSLLYLFMCEDLWPCAYVHGSMYKQ